MLLAACSAPTKGTDQRSASDGQTEAKINTNSGNANATPPTGVPPLDAPMLPSVVIGPGPSAPAQSPPATPATPAAPSVPPPPRCAGASTGATSDAGIVAVDYPTERAIFQRGSDNMGTVTVSLRASASVTCVDISTTLLATDASPHGTALPWQMLQNIKITANADGTNTLVGSFTQPAGGWYSLGFATWTNAAPTAVVVPHNDHTVLRLGVGEIFMVAGQSNSTNLGSVDMMAYQPDDHVVAVYNPTGTGNSVGDAAATPSWVLGVAPMPGPNDGGARGTPWGWAGTLLSQDLQVPVAFAVIGWQGTYSSGWLPGSFLHNRLIATGQYLTKYAGGFREVLWHQGESDALGSVTTADYQANLYNIIDTFRQKAGTQQPWLIARAAWLAGTSQSAINAVEAAQNALRADHGHGLYPGASTDDMISCHSAIGDGGYRDCINSNIPHFSYLGLTEHAQRWHDAIFALGGFPAGFTAAGFVETQGTAPTKLVFRNPAGSVATATCSLLNITAAAGSASAAPQANLTVNLSASPAAGNNAATFYSDSGCTMQATTTTIFATTATAGFYFRASSPGAQTITAAASGVASATTPVAFVQH